MRLTIPFLSKEVSVPAWSVVLAVLWPVVFLSFLAHSFAIGGDAFIGKVEAGRYYLWKNSRSENDATPYLEVSEARYRANYIHAIATMFLALPAFVSIWLIVHRICNAQGTAVVS